MIKLLAAVGAFSLACLGIAAWVGWEIDRAFKR